jgi:hypothetical protein
MLLIFNILIVGIFIFLIISSDSKNKFYYKHFWKPYKNIKNKNIKNILIGIPTIDRDSDIASKVYENLIQSINYFKQQYNTFKSITIDIIVITRKTDIKSISFWNNKAKIILVEPYQIKKRHNFEKLSEKFNKLIQHSKYYDCLMILESDIILKYNTIFLLYQKLKHCHISTIYYEIPWCKYPLVIVGDLSFKRKNARDIKNDTTILGHGTGAIMIRSEVFNNCNFNVGTFDGIEGQDIGFFMSAFKHRYKVCLVNQEVKHLYNRYNRIR